MTTTTKMVLRALLGAALAGLLLAACGGSDEPTSSSSDNTDAGSDTGADAQPDTDDAPSNAGSGGDSTMTLGDETIQLNSRCFLQEQDVVGSDGKILLTFQATGTNTAGENVVLDFSRFDEDSLFTGDDILVDIGDPFGDDLESWIGGGEIGVVEVDGNTLRASGLSMRNYGDSENLADLSFEVNC